MRESRLFTAMLHTPGIGISQYNLMNLLAFKNVNIELYPKTD